ncbi:MAG TPA: hypothetical protein VFQ68_11295, partial [Streptosporangiaceae bacterium]|nr:hypothetical protein [Streptosporangiaceae bacterium]
MDMASCIRGKRLVSWPDKRCAAPARRARRFLGGGRYQGRIGMQRLPLLRLGEQQQRADADRVHG